MVESGVRGDIEDCVTYFSKNRRINCPYIWTFQGNMAICLVFITSWSQNYSVNLGIVIQAFCIRSFIADISYGFWS